MITIDLRSNGTPIDIKKQKGNSMHPRERILGYIKYYQEQNKRFKRKYFKEAHKWRIDVSAEVNKLADNKLQTERMSNNEQD